MSFKQVFIYLYSNLKKLRSVLLQDYFGERNLFAWNHIVVYFAHSYVHRSFISCDIITSNDNALIQQLVQGTKGVTRGNKLIKKLGFWISPRGFCFSFFACSFYIYFLTFLVLSLFLVNFLSVYFKLRFNFSYSFIYCSLFYRPYVNRCLLISI